jgi:UDP-glucose 4-epimerase
MRLKNSRILVTGGAGFIGSHLCERLVSEDVKEVISLDNYFTGTKQNHVTGVQYLQGNTEDIDDLISQKIDIVFHLGEYSRVEQSFQDVKLVWKFNTLGTQRVLEFCLRQKSKLIYAGSSTKFGDGGFGREQSPYAWSKATNTELVRNYGNWFGLEYAITYFYNVYGGREISQGKYATLIGIFSEAYKNGHPLKVVMPGSQKRNFTHIDDIISALLLIGDKGTGDNYGIGNDKTYSVLEVAELFGSRIELIPARKGNRMSADIYNQKVKALGWEAKLALEDYVRNFKILLDKNEQPVLP